MKITSRIVIIALAIILFALGISCISYVSALQQSDNIYYFSFFETFIFTVIYVGPIYLVIGTPISILIDKLIKKINRKSKWRRYFIGLGMYSLAGIAISLIFKGEYIEALPISILGFIASNLFFHLSLLLTSED